MEIEIQQIRASELSRYAEIPIRYRVCSVLRVEMIDAGLGGLRLIEEAIDPPYLKDYDRQGDERPTDWPKRFDTRRWGFFIARDDDASAEDVGGATVAVDSPGVHMLEGRPDLAVLWDIRVRPEVRGRGVGTRLFGHAVDWAQAQGYRQLKIETQNVNVGACRFYAKQGCELGGIQIYGYAGCPQVAHETMLLWYLNLW